VRRSLPFVLFAGLYSSLVTAQTMPTTRLIPYLGTAVGVAGEPLRGIVAVVFELYEERHEGVPLWRERQNVQADDRISPTSVP
jgi:hypothetical protein